MPDTLTVFRPGEQINIDRDERGRIPATVVESIILPGEQIQYRVAWWDGRSREIDYINACELPEQDDQPAKLEIGFHGQAEGQAIGELPWVLDHENASPRQWHFYGKGNFEPAKCGKPPIPGMPICSAKPEATIAQTSVCRKCAGI